jgi:hypothetical protein
MRIGSSLPGFLVALIAALSCSLARAGGEERINAAVPLPAFVQQDLQELLERTASPADRAALQNEIDTKKRIRALTCAHGYSPGASESLQTVRARLTDIDCFSSYDTGLLNWTAWHRVGLSARLPPLRPMPAMPASTVASNFPISTVQVAASAGVMLLSDNRDVELVDLGSGKPILAMQAVTSGPPGQLSPNGRVFITMSPQRISLRDSESGKELVAVPQALAREFFWVSDRAALLNRLMPPLNLNVIQFDSGEESALNGFGNHITSFLTVPHRPGELFLRSYTSVFRARLTQSGYGDPIKVVDQRATQFPGAPFSPGAVTADGVWFVNGSDALTLTSTASLETTIISLKPFYVTEAFPLPNPDLLMLKGRMEGVASSDRNEYVYSLSHRTFAPIDPTQLNQTRVAYLPHLNKVALISAQRLTLVDSVPTLAAISQEQFLSNLRQRTDALLAQQNQHNAPPFFVRRQPTAQIPSVPSAPPPPPRVLGPHYLEENIAHVPGTLAVTHELGCIQLPGIGPRDTAADFYQAAHQCADQGRYEEAASLFMLAGAYGRYDAMRIADKTASQGLIVLQTRFSDGLNAAQRDGFRLAMQRWQGPASPAGACALITRLGPPSYTPSYLMLAGMDATFGHAPGPHPMDDSFDGPKSWERLRKEYLHCSP